jgi:hypothetical protein
MKTSTINRKNKRDNKRDNKRNNKTIQLWELT